MSDQGEDYYYLQAADAQRQADRAISARDRAAWLRIAQSWLGLLKIRALTAKETFDDTERDRGTHQDISKEPQ